MKGVRFLSGRCVTFTEEKGWGQQGTPQGPQEHSEGVRPTGVWIQFPQNFPCVNSSEGSPQAPNKETVGLGLLVPSLLWAGRRPPLKFIGWGPT